MGAWIGIAGTFVTMLAVFAAVVSRFSRMELNVSNFKEQMSKYQEKTDKCIDELYNSRNVTDKNLVELTTTIKMLVSSIEMQNKNAEVHFTTIDDKLEKITIEIRTKKEL